MTRTRKEIEEELKPKQSGSTMIGVGSKIEITTIELLLDLRDLLQPQITGSEKPHKCCDECWNSAHSLKNLTGSCGTVCECHNKKEVINLEILIEEYMRLVSTQMSCRKKGECAACVRYERRQKEIISIIKEAIEK